MGVCLSKGSSLKPTYICGDVKEVDSFSALIHKHRHSIPWEEARASTDSCDSSSMTRLKHHLCFCNSFFSSSLFQGIDLDAMLDGEQQIEAKIEIQAKNGVSGSGCSISGEIEIHGTKSRLCFPFEINNDELRMPGPQNSPVATYWLASNSDELGGCILPRKSIQMEQEKLYLDSAESAKEDVVIIDVEEVFKDELLQLEDDDPFTVKEDTPIKTVTLFSGSEHEIGRSWPLYEEEPVWKASTGNNPNGSFCWSACSVERNEGQDCSTTMVVTNAPPVSKKSRDGRYRSSASLEQFSHQTSSSSGFFSIDSLSTLGEELLSETNHGSNSFHEISSSKNRYLLTDVCNGIFYFEDGGKPRSLVAPLLLDDVNTGSSSRRSSSNSLNLKEITSQGAFGSPLSSSPTSCAPNSKAAENFRPSLERQFPMPLSKYASNDSSDSEGDDTTDSDDGSTSSSDLFELDSVATNLSSARSSVDPETASKAMAPLSFEEEPLEQKFCSQRTDELQMRIESVDRDDSGPRTHLIVYSSLGKRAKLTTMSSLSFWRNVNEITPTCSSIGYS